jgi:hypothetical protein
VTGDDTEQVFALLDLPNQIDRVKRLVSRGPPAEVAPVDDDVVTTPAQVELLFEQ